MNLLQEQGVESTIQTLQSPKVSVIVPVYKAEAYLNRCVDSLLAQTFKDFEILLIDDGSPDRSGEICDEYAKKDPRVRVIHKENGGVSSARQCGLDNARGEYVIHADPDDWTEPEMLEEMYRKAKEEDADMVICDYYFDAKGNSIYTRQAPSSLDNERILKELFQNLHGACWNKLVRRSCFQKVNVAFPDLSYCEDLYVNVCLVAFGVKIVYLNSAFYHYDQDMNPASLVYRPVKEVLDQEQHLYDLLKARLSVAQFSLIELYLKVRLLPKALNVGGDYLRNFSKCYAIVASHIKELDLSLKQKVLYWIAFHLSPYWAYQISDLFRSFRKRVRRKD